MLQKLIQQQTFLNMESEQTEIKKVVVPEGAVLIDEAFYVWKTRYGLYSTMTKQGRQMMTGGTKDGCLLYTSQSPRD